MSAGGPVWLALATRDEVLRGRHPERLREPLEAVVWHYTGAPGSPRRWLREREDGVAWCFTIERDGVVYQHAPLDARTGHAGGSTLGGRGNVNGRTIGVEVANLGPVDLLDGDPTTFAQTLIEIPKAGDRYPARELLDEDGLRFGRVVSGRRWLMPLDGDVFVDEHGQTWEAYTRAQLEAIVTLAGALARWSLDHDSGTLAREIEGHVGHGEIRENRRPRGVPEPDPCFPWLSLRDAVRDVRLTHTTP